MSISAKTRRRTEGELSAAFRRWVDTYGLSGTRSVDDIMALHMEQTTGFGTGRDERVEGMSGVRSLISREIAQVPEGFTLEVSWQDVHAVSVNVGVVVAEAELHLQGVEPMEPVFVRVSLVFSRQDEGDWLIAHLHVSVPWADQAEGETVPIDALRARAEYLEREVSLRTRDLEAARRNAEIEAAVERVRGRALAMRRSDELFEVADLLRSELADLDVPGIMGSAINLVDEDDVVRSWDRSAVGESDVEAVQLEYDPKNYPRFGGLWKQWKSGKAYFEAYFDLDNVGAYLEELRSIAPGVRDVFVKAIEGGEWTRQWLAAGSFTHGWIGSDLYAEPDEWTRIVHVRMAEAFDLAYKRFKDLQVAEAAAREARVEASLERVRTSTMAMRQSHQIGSILGSIFAELQALELAPAHCVMWIFHEDESQTEWYLANPEAESGAASYMVDHTDHPVFQAYLEAWRERREMWVYRLEGELKRTWDEYLFSNGLSALPPPAQEAMRSLEGVYLSNTFGDFGLLTAASHEPLDPEHRDIIQRFGVVFQQSYARFLDVRKAEVQAREAAIEASLERVRSRAMAMQHSDDLSGVVSVIFNELELSFKEHICIFINRDPGTEDLEWWSTGMSAGELPQSYRIPNVEEIRNHEMVRRYVRDLEDGTPYSVFELAGETKRSWDKLLFETTELKKMPEETKEAMMSFPKVFLSDAYLKNAMLEIAGPEPLSEDQAQTLQRFAKVVEFSYTRVADLQKAEEKAREAQIEAALERVRTRTMAMRQSAEIGSIVGSMFSELKQLDVALARCFIWVFHEDERKTEWFGALPEVDAAAMSFKVDYTDHPVHNAYYEAWRERRSMWLYTLGGDLKRSWEDYIFGNGLSELPHSAQEGMRGPDTVHLSNSFGDFGLLMAGSEEPLPKESLDIIQRFCRVFQQSYARFQDVRQAEIQARESRIEAAAERVRVAAMTMQTPDDLFGVVGSIREELFGLDIPHCVAAGVTIVNEDDKACLWDVTKVEGADDQAIITRLEYKPGDVAALDQVVSSWRSVPAWGVEDFDYDELLRLADEVALLNPETGSYMREAIEDGRIPHLWNGHAGFSHGFVHGDFTAVPGDDARRILVKMAGVFDLAYQRYLDLQVAEASAREARIEAAFERIRARALAMQSSDELAEVALELRKQMALLGEDFEGIAIHRYPPGEFDEFESWAAMQAPGQSEPIVMKTSFRASSCEVLRAYRHHYHSDRDEYTIDVEAESARGREWLDVLREASPEYGNRLESAGVPEWSFQNCADYSGGTIVMVTFRPLSDEQRELLQRAARVFDLAHQRYLDLTKAEGDYQALLAEKARTEAALTELRATQAQLVEQEKLASLGQLTAGIAHEIKNPLNFVNNFAEVSSELADELKAAIESGNAAEAIELLTNLRDNAAQIAKHGQRADSIVRSMMQHARGGTSDREAIDLNKFVGAYADLAWHGMRARHQELKAEVLCELAPDAGSILCMPQELGRVLLNLLNNAFDAVRETEGGEVTIRTSRSADGVLIEVCDNGPGVPEAIRDKIFEPFFTTKPTGKGTGLGLSLSYDIVTKGHGGTMTVSNGEQGGAKFVVSLPA